MGHEEEEKHLPSCRKVCSSLLGELIERLILPLCHGVPLHNNWYNCWFLPQCWKQIRLQTFVILKSCVFCLWQYSQIKLNHSMSHVVVASSVSLQTSTVECFIMQVGKHLPNRILFSLATIIPQSSTELLLFYMFIFITDILGTSIIPCVHNLL